MKPIEKKFKEQSEYLAYLAKLSYEQYMEHSGLFSEAYNLYGNLLEELASQTQIELDDAEGNRVEVFIEGRTPEGRQTEKIFLICPNENLPVKSCVEELQAAIKKYQKPATNKKKKP